MRRLTSINLRYANYVLKRANSKSKAANGIVPYSSGNRAGSFGYF